MLTAGHLHALSRLLKSKTPQELKKIYRGALSQVGAWSKEDVESATAMYLNAFPSHPVPDLHVSGGASSLFTAGTVILAICVVRVIWYNLEWKKNQDRMILTKYNDVFRESKLAALHDRLREAGIPDESVESLARLWLAYFQYRGIQSDQNNPSVDKLRSAQAKLILAVNLYHPLTPRRSLYKSLNFDQVKSLASQCNILYDNVVWSEIAKSGEDRIHLLRAKHQEIDLQRFVNAYALAAANEVFYAWGVYPQCAKAFCEYAKELADPKKRPIEEEESPYEKQMAYAADRMNAFYTKDIQLNSLASNPNSVSLMEHMAMVIYYSTMRKLSNTHRAALGVDNQQ